MTAVDWPPAAAEAAPQARHANSSGRLASSSDGLAPDGDTVSAAADSKPPAKAAAECAASSGSNLDGAASAQAAQWPAAGRGSETGSNGEAQERLARWMRQLSMFRFAAQDWTERLWQVLIDMRFA